MQNINIKKLTAIFTPNRVKILVQLSECDKEVCGCDLIKKISIPKNLLSYHIAYLRNAGLIEEKKCGQKKNYHLTDKGLTVVAQINKIEQVI